MGKIEFMQRKTRLKKNYVVVFAIYLYFYQGKRGK